MTPVASFAPTSGLHRGLGHRVRNRRQAPPRGNGRAPPCAIPPSRIERKRTHRPPIFHTTHHLNRNRARLRRHGTAFHHRTGPEHPRPSTGLPGQRRSGRETVAQPRRGQFAPRPAGRLVGEPEDDDGHAAAGQGADRAVLGRGIRRPVQRCLRAEHRRQASARPRPAGDRELAGAVG